MLVPAYLFLSETTFGWFVATIAIGLLAAFFWTALADRYEVQDKLVRVAVINAASCGRWDRGFHFAIYALAVIASLSCLVGCFISIVAWLVALARFAAANDLLAWALAKPCFILFAIIVGLFLYLLRRDHPLRYGLIEVLVSLAAMWIVISGDVGHVTRGLTLLGSVYVFIRGAHNIEKGLGPRKIPLQAIWRDFVLTLVTEIFPPSYEAAAKPTASLRVISNNASPPMAGRGAFDESD